MFGQPSFFRIMVIRRRPIARSFSYARAALVVFGEAVAFTTRTPTASWIHLFSRRSYSVPLNGAVASYPSSSLSLCAKTSVTVSSPCVTNTCFGFVSNAFAQSRSPFTSAWPLIPGILQISAATCTVSPNSFISVAPSSKARPGVPIAWYPTKSTVFLGSHRLCFR